MRVLIANLIFVAVNIIITATEMDPSSMSTDRVVVGTLTIISAAWSTVTRVYVAVFTGCVRVLGRVAELILAILISLATCKRDAPSTIITFISIWTMVILLTLWDAFPINAGLPIQTITFSWCVVAIYYRRPIANRPVRKLNVVVEAQGPLALAQIWVFVFSAGSTLKKTDFIFRAAFPESAAICIVGMIVRLLCCRVHKKSAIRNFASIVRQTLFSCVTPRGKS